MTASEDEDPHQLEEIEEHDEEEEIGNGAFLVEFPPWPRVPSGVNLLSFSDFKESGIQHPALGFPDGIEKDGQGIPTCRLRVDRIGDTEHISLTKRRKKKKKRKTTAARGPWPEEWKKAEDPRFKVSVDADLPAEERLERAAEEFVKGKYFSPEVQSIFDNMKLFMGIQPRNIQLPQTLREKEIMRDAENPGADYDEFDDEEEYPFDYPKDIPPPNEGEEGELPKEIPDEYDKADEEDYYVRLEEEARSERERKHSFFKDPYFSIQVFLSSYFRDKGLIWSTSRPADAPIVVEFFLNFILRHRFLPEFEEGIKRSLEIVEMAKIELPATGRISYSIPDQFCVICNETWGSQSSADKFAPRPMIIDEDDRLGEEEVSTPLAETDGIMNGTIVLDAEALESEMAGQGSEEANTWKWGASWGTPNDATNPWNSAQAETEAAWLQKETVSFMTLWGPVVESLAHTHEPEVMERTYRYISRVLEPGTFEGHEEVFGMSCAILAPWVRPKDCVLPEGVIAEMPLTSNLEASFATNGMKLIDEPIPVIFEASTTKFFHPGMIMRGECIKIRPKRECKSKHSWWYMERCLEVLPSYYAELSAPYINNLISG